MMFYQDAMDPFIVKKHAQVSLAGLNPCVDTLVMVMSASTSLPAGLREPACLFL